MSHDHKHSHHGHGGQQSGMRKHAKWITVVAVVAMIGAMLMYVFSNDEMLQPGQPVQNPVPAAAP